MVPFPVCATVSLRVISAVGEGGLLVQLAAFRTPRSRTESLLNGGVCRSQFASSCSDLQLPAPTSTSAFEPLTLKMIALAANGASANARAGARRMSAPGLSKEGASRAGAEAGICGSFHRFVGSHGDTRAPAIVWNDNLSAQP